MIRLFAFLLLIFGTLVHAATIAIIDTGFDLDHGFLRPKILKQETDEEAMDPKLDQKFQGWNFHDNAHLKTAVIEDQSSFQEVLLFRSLRAKGHKNGLSPEEFEWFSRKGSDKIFMEKVRQFKKHAHGTFVAGIALREGENISIFPIRGLNIPIPVVAVKDSSSESVERNKGKTPDEKFLEEISQSLDRVSRKFSKICHYLSLHRIEVVNASYGITNKNINTRFKDIYRELTGKEIDPLVLKHHVDKYFQELYKRGARTISKYPGMLFVFSAGNSGVDNDEFHHYPSKIKGPNTIAVAAMNGEYLASFSNFGQKHVDIGAPGVGILSLVPKVYSKDSTEIYSPSSGTSMAAPYISNLAAQIMNTNGTLSPHEVKRIILETGDEKGHLINKLISGSAVSNQKSLKATLLSKEMSLNEAINLAKLNIIPMEDSISFGQGPAVAAENVKKKVMEAIPQVISPQDIDEDPEETSTTKSSSSSPKNPEKAPRDNSMPPASAALNAQGKSSDPFLANQSEAQSPPPSEEMPAFSSQPAPSLPETQSEVP